MASRLLNMLSEIEQSRKECISTLHEKGSYILGDNASFEDINEAIDALSVVGGQPYVEIPGEPNMATLNSQNDPELWRRPANWPDIKAIIDAQEAIVEDGYTYLPFGIVLFLNDTSETTNFRFIATGNGAGHDYDYNRNDLVAGDFIVGASYHYNYSVSDTSNKSVIVKTSDEKSYTFRNTGTFQDLATLHTWDTSKDIHSGEDTFRYLIIFVRSITYNTNYIIDFTHVPHVVECSFAHTETFNTYYNISLDVLHFIIHKPTNNNRTISTSDIYINMSNSNTPSTYRKTLVRKLTLETSKLPYSGTTLFLSVDTIDCPLYLFTFPLISNFPNLLYLRCKCFNYFVHAQGAASYTQQSRLRYVVVVDTEYQEQNYFNVAGLATLDSLLEENFTQYIKSITVPNNNNYAIQGSFRDRGIIELPELTVITGNNAFKGIGTKHVYIPKITTAPNMQEGCFSELTIGCSFIPSGMPSTLKKLHLLGYTNGTLSTYNTYALEYLDLPNATALPSPINISTLKYLKLPVDFKFNVPFNGDSDNNKLINKQCILDIFRNCATLEEGESYTITIPRHLRNEITPEEIAVATNKGWTVN